jgi:hypothetical protein
LAFSAAESVGIKTTLVSFGFLLVWFDGFFNNFCFLQNFRILVICVNSSVLIGSKLCSMLQLFISILKHKSFSFDFLRFLNLTIFKKHFQNLTYVFKN